VRREAERPAVVNVDAYLDRIGYSGPREPTPETLRLLHRAHMLAVPFENLSIHAGEPIVLDDAALFDKIVARRRGGFCYELNGLFAALLSELGFEVAKLSAGVYGASGAFGPDFDHMTLLVTLEARWLADVGFGDSFLEPLRLDERSGQPQGDRVYRIDAEGDRRILQQRIGDGAWTPQYRFGLEPHEYADYAERCLYHRTSPLSHFTQNRVCSLAKPDGRVTLTGMRLVVTKAGARTERELAGDREHAEVLRREFGVSLASP
jgi:N-hydroxyarylamine O-acetyltransferase